MFYGELKKFVPLTLQGQIRRGFSGVAFGKNYFIFMGIWVKI